MEKEYGREKESGIKGKSKNGLTLGWLASTRSLEQSLTSYCYNRIMRVQYANQSILKAGADSMLTMITKLDR